MYEAARAVARDREISEKISAGCMAAVVEPATGKIYAGAYIDTSSFPGICAERDAVFHMVTSDEDEIRRVPVVTPEEKTGHCAEKCHSWGNIAGGVDVMKGLSSHRIR